ncbi:trypsin-like serine protease [Thalassotalea euphylliae]|uniref:trypsin-like serine protease n=1 Tax=Thalassotalea euphylliae TaxID=1655234 RepID=UPI0036453677
MKRFYYAVIAAAVASSCAVYAKNTNDLIKPQIVGGEPAEESRWPWMSALVFTSQVISTDLSIAGQPYSSQPFSYSPSGSAEGELVNCGIGDSTCEDASGKVCLIERGEINFSVKVNNCEASGGLAAIIYNNVDGPINGTLGEDFSGTIPAVSVTRELGLAFIENDLGKTAAVTVSAEAGLAQDSFCGATFLGGKWVLTAAHCVDDKSPGTFRVNVGEYDLSNGADEAINVANIYMHPDYDAPTLNNDMALLELTEEVQGQVVQLATKATTDQFAAAGQAATVMGWGGRTGYAPGEGPTGDFPDVLHQVELDLMTNEQCRQTFADSFGASPSVVGVTDVMICAGVPSGGKSSCQGDSGGPLVINTNEGWQQVGVVSWGIGCAAAGYPGVYARVAEFDNWLSAIYKGVAVDQLVDLHVLETDKAYETSVALSNNSNETVALSFSISGSNDFSVEQGQCNTLLAGEECELTVRYSSANAQESNAELVIETDNDVLASSAKLTARTIGQSNAIANDVSTPSEVTWHTGGAANWSYDETKESLASGAITDLQDSILMAVVSGAGQFTFEWSVSSEENTEDANDPFDALYLYVNGQQFDFISGEVDFTEYGLELPEGEHRLTWVYSKDPAATEGDDKGYVRNVTFTPQQTSTPTTPTSPTTASSSSSGGGGTIYWLAVLLGLVFFQKRKF